MARNLLEVKSKTSKLAGILCNIEDKEEGVNGSENSDNENHMVWRSSSCPSILEMCQGSIWSLVLDLLSVCWS